MKSFRPRRIAWLTLDAAERERAKSALMNERCTATAGNNVARRAIAAGHKGDSPSYPVKTALTFTLGALSSSVESKRSGISLEWFRPEFIFFLLFSPFIPRSSRDPLETLVIWVRSAKIYQRRVVGIYS